jgi:hypothetical protein
MDLELIKEVKRMNSFLEAIDWKLWEIYKKMSGTTASTPGATTEQPAPVTAPVVAAQPAAEEPVQIATPVIPVPSYPNIEKWK